MLVNYCFARPTHEYLGFNMGEDFEQQIVVKTNAVELCRAETEPARWAGDSIAMGTNTDPYQAAEGKYKLTKGIIEVLGRAWQRILDPHQVTAGPSGSRPDRRGCQDERRSRSRFRWRLSTRTSGVEPSPVHRIPANDSMPSPSCGRRVSAEASWWRRFCPASLTVQSRWPP